MMWEEKFPQNIYAHLEQMRGNPAETYSRSMISSGFHTQSPGLRLSKQGVCEVLCSDGTVGRDLAGSANICAATGPRPRPFRADIGRSVMRGAVPGRSESSKVSGGKPEEKGS